VQRHISIAYETAKINAGVEFAPLAKNSQGLLSVTFWSEKDRIGL